MWRIRMSAYSGQVGARGSKIGIVHEKMVVASFVLPEEWIFVRSIKEGRQSVDSSIWASVVIGVCEERPLFNCAILCTTSVREVDVVRAGRVSS